jgi:BirA family biotin operon repressor/biotin-[acetyl-CoA-carboxylase] ligase
LVSTSSDLPAGWRLAACHELDSTNAELKRRVGDGGDLAEGLVIRADRQTAGRGRQGRAWHGPAGNLYASFLLAAPKKSVAPQIGFVAAVAVIDTLGRLADVPLACKWPNDVLIAGKKVCGILPELVTDPSGGDWIVLGIGINLQPVTVPDAVYPVTSLAEHGVSASADTVVRVLAQDLAHRLAQWRDGGFAPIAAAWRAAGPEEGTPITVRLPAAHDDSLEGRFRGLDQDGTLLLDVNGAVKRIAAGEILFAPARQPAEAH